MDLPSQRNGAIRATVIGVVLIALFAFFFVYPGHDPEPTKVPLLLVGPGKAVPILEQGIGLKDDFEVTAVKNAAEAKRRILDREAYGAVDVKGPGPVLWYTSAASLPMAELMKNRVGLLAGESNLRHRDLRKIDKDDPRGLSFNLATIATTVPAILGALLLFSFAPAMSPLGRVLALAVFAALGGLASVLVIHLGIGSIPGELVPLWGVTAVAILSIAVMAAAIMQLLGPPGIGLSFIILLMLGNPASGAAAGPELLPEPWATGGQFLPPGAFATGLRNVAYFDGAQAATWLSVLIGYVALGALLLGWAATRARRKAEILAATPPPRRDTVDASV